VQRDRHAEIDLICFVVGLPEYPCSAVGIGGSVRVLLELLADGLGLS
jgi:hypothetical protein